MAGNSSISLEHSIDMDEAAGETVVANYAGWSGSNAAYYSSIHPISGYSSRCGGACGSRFAAAEESEKK